MLIVTSLTQKIGYQQDAIDSWQPYGKCYSLNSPAEIKHLDFEYIEIIETHRTIEHITGKPLVTINAMIDFAITRDEDLLIINSDIIIQSLPAFKQNGITLLHRYDYTHDINVNKIFAPGFDAFYIPKELLKSFPPSIYAMGACWWDYWLPNMAIRKGIKIYSSHDKHLFHKEHPIRYSMQEWQQLGDYFKLDFKVEKRLLAGQINTITLRNINQHIRYD